MFFLKDAVTDLIATLLGAELRGFHSFQKLIQVIFFCRTHVPCSKDNIYFPITHMSTVCFGESRKCSYFGSSRSTFLLSEGIKLCENE